MSMCEHVNNFTSIKTNRRSVFGRYHSRVVLPDVKLKRMTYDLTTIYNWIQATDLSPFPLDSVSISNIFRLNESLDESF